jgi:LCP family protein required for cell wall assembly
LGLLTYGSYCAAALAGGAALGWIGQSAVATEMLRDTIQLRQPRSAFDHAPSVNLLVLGCDEDRTPGGRRVVKTEARSDMILVVRIDFEANRITGLSIPRDLQVDLLGYRPMKINAFHAIGGPELSQRAVEEVLGVRIDRTMVLNYAAFQEMVDMVGGVPIFVPKRMVWNDRAGDLRINLRPGRQTLDGRDAMSFVRFRRGDDDFERQKRQKEFMLAFRDQAMRNPAVLGRLADKTVELLGGALTPREVAALVAFSRGVPSGEIRMGQVPVRTGRGTNLLVDRSALHDTLREFHFREPGPTTLNFAR